MPVRYHFAALGSTNARAADLLDLGEEPGFWVTADEQLTGRGRLGRDWSSPVGNLYATAALAPDVPMDRLPELPLVVAVAVHDAVAETTGREDLRLKWPNDLLAGGAKIAGILLEAGGRRDVVLAGIGINLVSHPSLAAYPTADLRSLGSAVDRDELWTALGSAVDRNMREWHSGGFGPFRQRWLRVAHGLGSTVRVRTPSDIVEGVADGIDEQGRLLLRTAGGVKTMTAGDWLPDASQGRSDGHGSEA